MDSLTILRHITLAAAIWVLAAAGLVAFVHDFTKTVKQVYAWLRPPQKAKQ